MNKTKWIITIVVITVITLLGAWYYFYRDTSEVNTIPTSAPAPIEEATDSAEKAPVKSVNLIAVSPYTGNGKATRVFDGKTFTHTVTATVSDPASGKFLEGWLVKNSATKEFFSTGKLVKDGGVYKLNFTTTKNFPDHNNVVITEETEANGLDGIPEAHVLEGSFAD